MQVARRISGPPDFVGPSRNSDLLESFWKPDEGFLWDYVSNLEAPSALQDDRSTITSAYPAPELMAENSGQTLTPTSSGPAALSQDASKLQAKKLKEQAKNRRSESWSKRVQTCNSSKLVRA